MTRFLSEALGAVEPVFSRSIQQLERAAGLPGTDIRLTSDIIQGTRAKIMELGLDPSDTTGPELYRALQIKLSQDEVTLRKALGVAEDAAPEEVVAKVAQYLGKQSGGTVFALKSS